MGFASVEEIETRAKEQECQLWETILHDDMTERQVDRLESIGKMSSMYLAMKEANESYDKDLKSQSGLSGGDGEKMMEEVRKMQNLTGEFVGTVMANALKMGESNACMKRIVAAPTAGACGVLPAVLITYEQFHKVPEAKMLEGMYIAAGVGQVIAERACIAGAQGGCQAEIGSASCMAATAITYIRGGSTKQIFDAGAFALKSLLGLVCDPLGGLVEVPCIKRNVIGSVNAITASSYFASRDRMILFDWTSLICNGLIQALIAALETSCSCSSLTNTSSQIFSISFFMDNINPFLNHIFINVHNTALCI